MADVVIDANVLMSILISGKSAYRPLLTYNHFIAPEFVMIEVDKYSKRLQDRTKMTQVEFLKWSYFVFSNITIFPQYVIDENSLVKSVNLLERIDIKDTAYVALAMQLDLVLLTRDNPLYTGLRKQGFRKIMLFEDFLRSL